jgi:hypothetical protein
MTTAMSTASGRKKIIDESSAAITNKPHEDKKPPKIDAKKPRIIG